jgi:hypothetical protein
MVKLASSLPEEFWTRPFPANLPEEFWICPFPANLPEEFWTRPFPANLPEEQGEAIPSFLKVTRIPVTQKTMFILDF